MKKQNHNKHILICLSSFLAILFLFSCETLLQIGFEPAARKHYPALKAPARLWKDAKVKYGFIDEKVPVFLPESAEGLQKQGYEYIGLLIVQCPEEQEKELDDIMAREAAKNGGHEVLIQRYHVKTMRVWDTKIGGSTTYESESVGVMEIGKETTRYESGTGIRNCLYNRGHVYRKSFIIPKSVKTYEYNNLDQLQRENLYDGKETLQQYVIYEYNSSGLKTKIHLYKSPSVLLRKTGFEYSARGKLIKELLYSKDETKPSQENIFEYDSAEKLIKKSMCRSGQDCIYEKYEYDDSGRLSQKAFHQSDDTIWEKVRYKYDKASGRLIEETKYDKNNKVIEKIVYEYDQASGKLLQEKYSGPGSYYQKAVYKYDSEKEAMTVSYYDLNGDVTMLEEFIKGKQLKRIIY